MELLRHSWLLMSGLLLSSKATVIWSTIVWTKSTYIEVPKSTWVNPDTLLKEKQWFKTIKEKIYINTKLHNLFYYFPLITFLEVPKKYLKVPQST